MDMQMPVMDGVDACEIIMKRQVSQQQQSRLLPLTLLENLKRMFQGGCIRPYFQTIQYS
jgi:CheY-like chemotaxis protein